MGDPRIDGKRIRILSVAGRKQISGCANRAIEMPAIVMVMMKSDRDAGDQIDQGYEGNKFLVISLQEVHSPCPKSSFFSGMNRAVAGNGTSDSYQSRLWIL